MCFPAAVLHSPVPRRCRTFLLPERMLQMSANESCENDLWSKLLQAGWRDKSWAVRGFCVTGGLNHLRGAPQQGHIWFVWFAWDSEGLAAAPDGEASWLWETRESAKRHAVCHSHCGQLAIRRGRFGRKALWLFLRLSAVFLWPSSVDTHPTSH